MKFPALLLSTLLLALNTFAQQPKIIGFSPASGIPGSIITINGTNFSPVPANNIVFFGSVRAQVNTASATSITVTVPNGASYQPFTVTCNGFTAYSSVPFNITFPSHLVLATSSLVFKDSFPSGSGPIRIITCDFNNDGKPDLACINDTSNTVAVFTNTSSTNNILFASKIDFPTGNRPRGIASGDIDGDGKPDIVIANANSNTVSVYRNTSVSQGAISFASKIDFITNTDPRGVVVVDIDNDGKSDIVTCTYLGGTLSISRNTSSGATISFAPRVDLDLTWATTSLVAADFNLDGKVDLAVPNANNQPIAFFKNNSSPGTILFDPIKAGPVVSGSYNIPINLISGDIDNDGKTDLVTNGTVVAVLQNISPVGGDIVFKLTQTFFRSTNLPGLAMANITNDGKANLVSASEEFQGIIFINSNNSVAGNPSFGNTSAYNTLLRHTSIAVADFDADGRADLATANWYSRNIAVYKNIASDIGLNSFVSGNNPSSTGDLVTLHGANLTKVQSVSFGGSLADSFRVIDSSKIIAYVGAGSSGNVSVNSATGSASLPGFVFAPPPVITSFTPTIAGEGDTIIVKGTKFQTAHTVLFGSVTARSFIVLNDSTIAAVVDTGASGSIIIKTSHGTALKSGFTFVHSPVIYSFTPKDALPGTTITISGHSFTYATKLLIADNDIQPFTIVSDSVITAPVSSFAGGKISIISAYGTGELNGFYNGPVIDTIDIYIANANTGINIRGKNFANSPAENVVRVGDAVATIVSATSNTIYATVPVGSNFGPVTVAAHHHTAYSNRSFLQSFSTATRTLFANTFLPKKQVSSLYNSMTGMDAADLDGDGKIDFVVSETSAGQMLVYKNVGSTAHASFIAAGLPTNQGFLSYQKLSLNDLNSDGKPEIVAISYGDVAIFENSSSNGNISFLPVIKFPFSATALTTQVADLDGDGKPEIIKADYLGFTILQNVSSPGHISFSESPFYIRIFFQDYTVKCMSLGDYDGDGKPDIAISLNHGITYIYQNISKAGNILFKYEPYIIWNAFDLTSQVSCDIDGDGKEDMIGTTSSDKLVFYRNISSAGNISFAPAEIINGISYVTGFAIADFDGNGKPDIAEISNYSYVMSIILNESTAGSVLFGAPIKIGLPVGAYTMAIGDFDADEKPDVAVIETNADYISIFRNRLGEILPIEFCPPVGDAKIYAGITGSTYQWQMDSGTGFVQITNNSNYTGTTTDTLRLTNIPSSWSGRKFRCLINDQPGEFFQLAFTDTWTGIVDDHWENAANWNCGVVPDENTDVVINSGSITISQNTIIRSLTVDPSVNIHITPGVHLVILH